MDIFPHNKTYDFMGKRWLAYLISLFTIVASFYLWFSKGEDKYGLDFTGGHEIVVRVEGGPGSEALREALSQIGLDDVTVQSFELGSNEYSIRFGENEEDDMHVNAADQTAAVRESVREALLKKFPNRVEILSADFVGPTVGKELRRQATWAALLSLVAMLCYIGYRFEMAFGVGALVAGFHDVVVAIGIYLLCGHSINMSALAGALTIVGYSVNDTIVVYDRIREEIVLQKGKSLEEIINYSVSVTLNRTIITNLLTFFSAVALYFFCSGAVEDMSLLFMAGVITGTFSTIYVASPVSLAWADFREARAKKK
ncbi:MAG: protein translocase subunit SecF [Deltaproteobacteria bacterium]|nr:protein translocase subunit SecF [Deltaproteobacteria bacterium]